MYWFYIFFIFGCFRILVGIISSIRISSVNDMIFLYLVFKYVDESVLVMFKIRLLIIVFGMLFILFSIVVVNVFILVIKLM